MVKIYIRPFIESTVNVFKTMLQMSLQPGTPTPLERVPTKQDVSGIIGMSGDVVGVVILGFPTKTAEAIVEKFAGGPMELGTEDFADAIGELVNMVAGNAKAQFVDKAVSISCPSVIFGGNHMIALPGNAVGLSIPFNSALGPFAVDFSLKMAEASDVSHVAANQSL